MIQQEISFRSKKFHSSLLEIVEASRWQHFVYSKYTLEMWTMYIMRLYVIFQLHSTPDSDLFEIRNEQCATIVLVNESISIVLSINTLWCERINAWAFKYTRIRMYILNYRTSQRLLTSMARVVRKICASDYTHKIT